jgi:hypothetical protein
MASRDKPRHEVKKPKKSKTTQGQQHGAPAPKQPLGGLPHS